MAFAMDIPLAENPNISRLDPIRFWGVNVDKFWKSNRGKRSFRK